MNCKDKIKNKIENINNRLNDSITDIDSNYDLYFIYDKLKTIDSLIDEIENYKLLNKDDKTNYEKEQLRENEIQKKTLNDIFPYLYCLYNYHQKKIIDT